MNTHLDAQIADVTAELTASIAAALAPVRTKRGPTKPATYAAHLRAAGYLVIPPRTSRWRRLVIAWRGAT